MTLPCLALPHALASGPAHMAMDEAMLESVAADGHAAALRTYAWPEPTLSLGYFQRLADAEADPRWWSVPLVRRASGGGAIWHDREITYAVAIPAAHPLARRPADLYRAVHAAIVDALVARGVPARRRGESEGPPPRPFLCFADRDPEDVVVAGAKVVGSAQRRRAGAVLQQGSLLLARSATTPELPGLADLGDAVPSEPGRWIEPLRALLAGALGLAIREATPPRALLGRAAALESLTYRADPWTRRR